MSIDHSLFRQVMGHFASGVTIVTSAHAGSLAGLTVSSFTSLSLDPTLVLVCIDGTTTSHKIITASQQFAVNVLSEAQEYLSRRFATQDAEKFVPESYGLSVNGLPLLHGALAHLECRLVNAFPGGDHTIFTGEVIAANVARGRPLIYYRSGYYQLG